MTENAPQAAVYARASTSDQNVGRQLGEAREHLVRQGVDDIVEFPGTQKVDGKAAVRIPR
jgi:DNA invertase Pin-like site-specific DNA recombinase